MYKVSSWLIEYGVTYLLYLILVLVMFYLIRPLLGSPIRQKMAQVQYRFRIHKLKAQQQIVEVEKSSGFIHHIHMSLQTVSKSKYQNYTFSFLVLCGTLFSLTTALVLINLGDLILSLLFGTFVGIIPYIILQIRLYTIRNHVGNDLGPIVQMLIQNYNSNQYDIYRALLITSQQTKNKTLKRVFVRLISDMQVSRGEKEIKEAIQLFIYTCKNNWAKRLGNAIIKAYLYDERITRALLTLGKQMESNQEMLEEEKSSSTDTVWNGVITVPVFVASIFLANYVTGPEDYFKLQFENFWTLLLFISSLCMTILSVLFSYLLRNPKNDL